MTVVVTEALFNQKPVASLKIGDIPESIRETRKGLTERIVVEHEMADAQQSYHGKHIMGSARAFVGDVDSLTPEAPPYAQADGYAKGRLQYHPTQKTVSVFTTVWEPLGYVDKVSAETIAGVKTFGSVPKVPETAFGTLTGPEVPSRSSVKAYIDAEILAAKNAAKAEAILACWPVGSVYIQYPGMAVPTGFLPGNWANISASFAGGFFRVEGGKASAFGSGPQEGQILEHSHSHSHTATINNDDGTGAEHGAFINTTDGASTYADVVVLDTVAPVVSGVVAGDENRPRNWTVVVWQRTP